MGYGAILLFVLLVSLSRATAYNYYLPSSYIDGANNLALGRPAYQSSTHGRAEAHLAVDGGLSGDWDDGSCIHTNNDDASSWWTVELAESGPITVVQLYNRLDNHRERLLGVEIRAGDTPVDASGDGTDNPVCEAYTEIMDTAVDSDEYIPTLFRFGSCSGRFVTVRLPRQEYLHFCEAKVFSEEKATRYIVEPQVEQGCPAPLRDGDGNPSCAATAGETEEQAYVRAFMEGPIDCGGNGFFCRMTNSDAGVDGGMTGTPGDELYKNHNFGYCGNRAEDREIDWNDLGRQPAETSGHCHGSDFDSSYNDLLHDHYYRPYRGDVECCCGLERRDQQSKWAPARNFISRCDYRGQNDNDADENYEDGCGMDMTQFIPKEAFPNSSDLCWSLKNFGNPPTNVYEMPPYTRPQARVPFCQGGESTGWAGCLVSVDARKMADTLVMVSPSLVPPRYIDKIRDCRMVHGVELSEVGLMMFEADKLDENGHETTFFQLDLPDGQSTAYFQVMDESQCGLSAVVAADIPPAGLKRKALRRLLGFGE